MPVNPEKKAARAAEQAEEALDIEKAHAIPQVSTFRPKAGRLYFDPSSDTLVRFDREGKAVRVSPIVEAADESF